MSALNDTKYDIVITQGTDFLVSLILLDEDGAAVDASAWTLILDLPFTGTALLTDNRVDIRVASDVVLPEGFATGYWFFDVIRQDAMRIRLLSGTVTVV